MKRVFEHPALRLSVLSLLLSGCITMSDEGEREPTLANMADRTDIPSKAPLPEVTVEQAMEGYQRVLQRNATGKTRAEAMRRMADLMMRLAETKMLAEADGDLSKLTPVQASASYQQAVDLYKQLLQEFPDYGDKAGVFYQLAKAYDLTAERDASLQALASLALEYPADLHSAEAQFRRGEAAFVARQWQEAENAYTAVLQAGESAFNDQARYKRGWARYKRGDYEYALDDFQPLLERLRRRDERDIQVRDLRDDTLRVMALSFANLEGAVSIREFFASKGEKPYEADVYRALANLYLDQERFADAADTYNTFIVAHPLDSEAPSFSTAIIETYQRGGFPTKVLPAKEDFAERYGRRSEFWARARGNTREQLLPQLKGHIRDVATHYHAKAQKSKVPEEYRVAAKWYREYLDTFPSEPEAPELHYLLADTLLDAKAIDEAAIEYEKVAYDYPPHAKSEQAGYAALGSYGRLMNLASGKDEAGKAVKGGETNAEALNRWQRESIRAGVRYVDAFTADPKAANVLQQVQQWQLAQQDIAGAVATSRRLVQMPQATNAQQREAKVVIANGEFDLQNWQAAEIAYGELLALTGWDNKTEQQYHERRASSIYKQAEMAVAAGDKQGAIDQFLRLGQVEPNASVRANAEYDAGALLLEVADFPAAITVFERFRQMYPKHELVKGISEKLAFAYEQSQQWGQAAQEYAAISQTSTDPEFARATLQRAAEYQEKSGQKAVAINTWKDYVKRFPQPFEEAQEVRAKIAQYYADQKDTRELSDWRKAILDTYNKQGGEKSPRMKYLAAQSEFFFSEPLMDNFRQVQLKLPLNKTLKTKRAAMQKALDAYEKINNYQVAEYTTAATHRIGEIYRILAKDLMNSERPKGLDADALDEYNVLLEEQAFPFEDKAIEFFSVNLSYIRDGVYTEWIEKSVTSLRELQPARYGKTEYVETVYE